MASQLEERQSAPGLSSPNAGQPNPGQMGQWLTSTVDLVFPQVCRLCGVQLTEVEGSGLCESCEAEITSATTACSRCAYPLPVGTSSDPASCPNCRATKLPFDYTIALGVYEGLLREAVLKMKSPSGELTALTLGRLLAAKIAATLVVDRPDCIVPVPTHWSRRIGRDLNCAELVSEAVSAELNVRTKSGLLRCQRRMQKQATLLPTERRENVRGAYAVNRVYDVRGQHVLIIDDVMTTGATAGEIAKVLRKGGATGISVAVVARGIGFDD